MASLPFSIAQAFVRGMARVVDFDSQRREDRRLQEESGRLVEKSWRKVGDAISSATSSFGRTVNQRDGNE